MGATPAANDRQVRGTLVVTLVLNVAVAGAKLAVGALINSISMVADGFHSLTDASSNVIGLVAVSLAARPPDRDHPYGHRKFETVATLVIGGLLTLSAWEILRAGVGRLRGGGAPEVGPLAFAVMGATMAVNLFVAVFEHRRGLALRSELLVADAAHTRSDLFASLTVIVSLIVSRLGYPQIDLAVALVLAALIAHTALAILRRSLARLTDTAAAPAEAVAELALSVEGVESVHGIRTRVAPGGGYADLHIQVRPDLPLDQAHAIGHKVADRLRDELDLDDVITHVEPPVGHRAD